jgi:putative endonuclease
MASHNVLGKYGEELGRIYLEQHEFEILHRNWRYSYYEIDIIGAKDRVLHFIEVKACRSFTYGYPDENVNKRKLRKIMEAAEEFLVQFPEWERVQYDILSICIYRDKAPEYFFIEDVSL